VVLVSTHALPLHIFEERYKQMIEEAARPQVGICVVLAGEKGM